MAKSAKSSKSTPKINYALMIVLQLRVVLQYGVKVLDTVAFIPNDLPLLESLRAEMDPGSRRIFTPSPEKVEVLYNALVAFKNSQPYGSASWLAAKSAQDSMCSLHAYAKKAGRSASYRLVVNSKPQV